MTAATIVNLLDHSVSVHYVLIAQGVSTATARHLTATLSRLNVVGIYFTPAYTRVYPNGGLASNLVGFTTTSSAGDLAGQAGIEESFNSLLAGRDGVQAVETSTGGQPIPVASDWVRPLVPGGNVRLTILSGLQWEAQQACEQQVKAVRADSCTVVVLRPQTGQILALAQYPGYLPSDVTSLAATQDLPASAVFPPGSTAKVITAAAALEHGQTPMTPYTVPAADHGRRVQLPGRGGAPHRAADPGRDPRPLQQRRHGAGRPARQPARCSTSTTGRSGSGCRPGCRCPPPAPASCHRRRSGGATSATPSPSAREWR